MTSTCLCARARAKVCAALVALFCGAPAVPAIAQGSTATVEVRVAASPPGDSAAKIPVQLLSIADPLQSWSAEMLTGESVRFRLVPPGAYRLISGDVERRVEVASGDEVTVDVRQPAASDRRDVRVTARDRTAYGTRFDAAALELLPQSNGVYGLIERSDPLVITEHIEGGGTYPEPQRLGASGASWTQTSFKLGDADITDPDRTGYAMLYPNLDALQAVGVATAGIHPDTYGAGTAVTLAPRMPSSKWVRTVQVDLSPPALQSVNPLQEPPAASLARLRSSSGGSVVASGPLTPRLGIQLAGTLNEYTRLERERVATLPSRTRSFSAHLAYKAEQGDDIRLFAQTDRLSFPSIGRAMLIDPALQQREQSTLITGTWNRATRAGLAWSANLTYAHAGSDPALAGTAITGITERLRDGPPYELAAAGESSRHRTSLQWRGEPRPVSFLGLRHLPELGATVSWTASTRQPPGASVIGELVDGEPARVWEYTTDGAPSRWRGTEFALWATNEIPVMSRVDIDLGVRASSAGASRGGDGGSINWRTLSPSILGTYRAMHNGRLTFLAGYARYASRLPLNYLAFGDPHSLSGVVRRWNDLNRDQRLQPGEPGVVIAAVGPCCANGRPNTIADDLSAPRMTEVRAALQTRLWDHWVLRLGGTDRRQYRLIQPVNAAASAPGNYSLTHVEDKALDQLVDADDQLLPIFGRLPASFGTDSYTLQNVEHNSARDHGLDLVLERIYNGRWGMWIGGTAHKSEGIGGNRGFRPDENDQGVIGEVFSEPNAETFARGRLFFERGYVAKWSVIYQLPYGLRGGTVARYADGQHFSRVVIARNVPQGVDFIPALPRGLTRYTYAFTLDTRLEKQITLSGRRATVVLDVFNLLNTNNEVEEDEVTGPAFRNATAVQPPRSVRFGFRLAF
jgi:hypothetical protein